MDQPPAPLIVTAQLPPDLASWATELRRRHYPPDRNFLRAHVTLFHALLPSAFEEVRDTLMREAATSAAPVARLEGVMPMGRGTALRIASPDMLAIRARLADCFHGLLTAQDMPPPRLHVTVQNKVPVADAQALQAELEQRMEPRDFAFAGLELHAYRGGPWEFVKAWRFRGRKGG